MLRIYHEINIIISTLFYKDNLLTRFINNEFLNVLV